MQNAREAEQRGDYNDAGNQYYGLLKNEFNMRLPRSVQVAAGRTASVHVVFRFRIDVLFVELMGAHQFDQFLFHLLNFVCGIDCRIR